MRLTLGVLGFELDVTLGPAAADEPAASLDGGSLTSYPVGFAAWPVPEEIPIQPHTPAWDEPEERGQ